jgi:hypothetical protein
MQTPCRFLVLILVLFALGSSPSTAAEKIRAALYMAENEPPPPGAQPAPARLHQQLADVFGFQHYHLLKQQDFALRDEWQQWFIPRRDFFVSIQPMHRELGQPKMIEYEIYKDGFIVVKGTYEVHVETPLFITGPDFRRGRLILVLEAH